MTSFDRYKRVVEAAEALIELLERPVSPIDAEAVGRLRGAYDSLKERVVSVRKTQEMTAHKTGNVILPRRRRSAGR